MFSAKYFIRKCLCHLFNHKNEKWLHFYIAEWPYFLYGHYHFGRFIQSNGVFATENPIRKWETSDELKKTIK